MKRLIWLFFAVFLLHGASEAHHPQNGRNYRKIYSRLDTDGEWVNVRFGVAWRPFHVDHQWRPYLRGRWVWTDYGWYWNSYEPFGWATYHYGRWTYDDYYGWIWIPGDEWGPAWVEWRMNDDYIGWAPLPPTARWSLSVGITFGGTWVAPVHYWNFVPCGNFSSVSVVNYIQPPDVTRRIFGRTRRAGTVRTFNNRIVNDAVRLDRVQRSSRETIRKVDLVDRADPGQERIVRKSDRESLEVYRPGAERTVRSESTRGRAPASASPERDARTGFDQGAAARDARRDLDESRPARNAQRSLEAYRAKREAQRSIEENRVKREAQRSIKENRVKRDAQRSVEQVRPERTYRAAPAESRGRSQGGNREIKRERTQRPQSGSQVRPSVTPQRPSGTRQAAPSRGSGSKKDRPHS